MNHVTSQARAGRDGARAGGRGDQWNVPEGILDQIRQCAQKAMMWRSNRPSRPQPLCEPLGER